MKKILLLSTLSISCVSKTPTTYELDKRAGLTPEVDQKIIKTPDEIKVLEAGKKKKQADKTVSVWIYAQKQKSYVIEGTWAHIEVKDGDWEVEK